VTGSGYAVYLLASGQNGTLYVGATNDLIKRVYQHRTSAADGFTSRYGVSKLVWFELHESSLAMVTRERQIKEWKRQWKIRLIEEANPSWRDLYDEILR
jgi:putative endonuclease